MCVGWYMCVLCQLSPLNQFNGAHEIVIGQQALRSDLGEYGRPGGGGDQVFTLANSGTATPDNVLNFGRAEAITFSQRSGDSTIDGVLSGFRWSDVNLTYSFTDSPDDYSILAEGNLTGFKELSAQQKYFQKYWLDKAASVSGLTFTELDGEDGALDEDREAVIKFANGDDPPNAYAYYPLTHPIGGDVWYGPGGDNPNFGTYDFMALGHELGHALGLSHGHTNDRGFGSLDPEENSHEYSIMTYHTSTLKQGLVAAEGHFAQTYMMSDIAALQFLYGANFDYNSDDTVYSINSISGELIVNGVGEGHFRGERGYYGITFRTIWDGNGNDTYDLSNFGTRLSIDLTPGGWVDLDVGGRLLKSHIGYDIGAGDWVLSKGQIANALQYNGDTRSLIENAKGGSNNDRIFGNSADNKLWGNAGDDAIYGRDGNDWLIGGAGDDELFGGRGDDRIDGGAGDDIIHDTSGNSQVDGGDGLDTLSFIYAGEGMRFELGQNTVFGTNTAISYRNIEVLEDSENGDRINGSAGDDVFVAGKGDDTFGGSQGDDTFFGGADNDTFFTGQGKNTLYGESGNDRLVSTFLVNGFETFNGGSGSDWYDASTRYRSFDVDLNAGRVISNGYHMATLVSVENVSGSQIGDRITGDGQKNHLLGNRGNDRLEGGHGNDTLDGGTGDDHLFGGRGNDTIFGGDGDDIIDQAVDWERDQIDGGSGIDTIRYGRVSDPTGYNAVGTGIIADLNYGTVRKAHYYYDGVPDRISNIENIEGTRIADVIKGDSADNTFWGLDGNDRLEGRDGDDVLHGGKGNDTLDGGRGSDLLIGGTGRDTFRFTTDGGPYTLDTISDFERGLDFLDVWGLEYDDGREVTRLDTNRDGRISTLDQGWSNRGEGLSFDGFGDDLVLAGIDWIYAADIG